MFIMETPIILIDADSQSSLTTQLTKEVGEYALIDYFEGKVTIKDLIKPVSGTDNIYLIPSNLNNIYLDKALSKPSLIKTSKVLQLLSISHACIEAVSPFKFSNVLVSSS